jgi:hypothetical protein
MTVLSVDPEYGGNLVCPHCKQERDISAYPDAAPRQPAAAPRQPAAAPHQPAAAPRQPAAAPHQPGAAPRQHGGAATEFSFSEPGGTHSRPGVLVWEKGDTPVESAARTVILKKGVNTIGRGEQCTIRAAIIDEYMSRLHARIEMTDNNGVFEHILSDAGSANGTYHNGEKLEKGDAVILKPDDRIRIGHTTYRFILT